MSRGQAGRRQRERTDRGQGSVVALGRDGAECNRWAETKQRVITEQRQGRG